MVECGCGRTPGYGPARGSKAQRLAVDCTSEEYMPESSRDNPGIIAPPPLLYLVPLLLGLLLQRVWPIALAPAGLRSAVRVLGGVLIVLWVILSVTAIREFRRAGTHVIPTRPATTVVDTGPYRFTRNPMYLGLTLLYLAVTLLTNALWTLLLLPVVLLVMQRTVIDREERYLERKFGEEYRRYKARVRRWI